MLEKYHVINKEFWKKLKANDLVSINNVYYSDIRKKHVIIEKRQENAKNI